MGITDDSDHAPGNFDGYGNSFSAQALADAGITPGAQVTTSYFNRTTSGAARTPSLFAAAVSLRAGKTVVSVTLPDVSGTTVSTSTVSMHIFAIGIG